ncbi:uncharacterized protein EV154DRAFT_423527 [Mucor mucedo]|uniref:uncharacterized protein n=1 Tax=Mucor mucedo TaxID=29922 RepID=UPI002220203C|nr:uncharacterized protein EV154DRAFT_423527 [Mucor mucedo]KAI7889660.1 hypothetical protein EV154DRAFT_423527 [Mucor mucedo]
MRKVKDILLNILGYIPVFYFLVVLYGNGEYAGPYGEVDKRLLLLYQIMHIADCTAADGGYTLFLNKFKEISSNEGFDFSDRNYSPPVRKKSGINLTSTELIYNTKFVAFRSGNEALFSVLASKFDRFNNNKAALQISRIETYNHQYKVSILLYNIWRFVETFQVEVQPHHMLGHNDDFEFPTRVNRINYVFLNEAKNDQKYNEMIHLQE